MRKLIIVLSIIIISCCNNKYPYEKGLRSYMKENFKLTSLNGRYYFVFLDSCNECLGDDLNLNFFIDNSKFKNLTIIFVGQPIGIVQNKKIELINRKYKVYTDFGKKIFSYETGFFKPMLLDFKDNTFVFYKEIDDFKLPSLKKYLQKK